MSHSERRIVRGEHVRHDALSRRAAYRPTCALCGERDATTTTEWEGRNVNACEGCLVQPEDFEYVDPPEHAGDEWDEDTDPGKRAMLTRRAVQVVLSSDGMSLPALLEHLGVEVRPVREKAGGVATWLPGSGDYRAVVSALSRAVAGGEIVARFVEIKAGSLPKTASVPRPGAQRILDGLDEGMSPDEVADELGVTVDAVYRVRRRWRPRVRVYGRPEGER